MRITAFYSTPTGKYIILSSLCNFLSVSSTTYTFTKCILFKLADSSVFVVVVDEYHIVTILELYFYTFQMFLYTFST